MSKEELQSYLEALVAEGIARGLTERQAEDFANNIYFLGVQDENTKDK